MNAMEIKTFRVLCADDNGFFRNALTTLFASAGHQVRQAENGHEAWDILLESMDQIDVVVTDHQMPGFTGLELVQLLRQTTFRGRIYVYTSALSSAEEQSYRELGVNGIFLKSVALEEVLRQVEEMRAAASRLTAH